MVLPMVLHTKELPCSDQELSTQFLFRRIDLSVVTTKAEPIRWRNRAIQNLNTIYKYRRADAVDRKKKILYMTIRARYMTIHSIRERNTQIHEDTRSMQN